LRRVSGVLDQARFAFDQALADRSLLLIVEFDFQVVVPGPGEVASLRESKIREIGRSGLIELAKILSFPANMRPCEISPAQEAVCERRMASVLSNA
jgi:hypothetical protein